MLAVDTRWRNRGIGRALKQAQRRRLLDQGIERARWTYDPLVARNANLNLNHLRVRVIDYVPNMYGENPMSRTDSVIGSDRFVVEWDLRTAGVRAPATPPDCPAIGLPENALDAYPEVPKLLVRIPDDIQALKVHDRDAAVAWRRLTRSVITYYLSEGYEVTGFRSGPGASAYVLEAGR
jgi:predicted GNAT superfamily acetyltransferase